MGGGGKAWPSPGIAGNGLGTNARLEQADPLNLPDYRPAQPLNASQPLKPLSLSRGRSLQPGQAAFPIAQTASNPWGAGRGGSGAIPVSRRPGTLPGTRA